MAVDPLEVLARLVIATALGAVVSWIYRATRGPGETTASFPPTLVLLSVLIAMVLQVVGDSVARAFSLVGALSVVRFRTVVRDTQDTAFVIFAVVVGMATGASDPRVAVVGIVVVGVAAFLMRRKTRGSRVANDLDLFDVKVRVAAGTEVERTIGAVLDANVASRRLTAASTARQGQALDTEYIVSFRPGTSADQLVVALNKVDSVESVEIALRDEPADDLD
jgi:hypothetical protein